MSSDGGEDEFQTIRDQQQTEGIVLGLFKEFMMNCDNPEADDEIILEKDTHFQWIAKAIHNMPGRWQGLDASRPWFVFWMVHSLDLMKMLHKVDDQLEDHVATFLATCQSPTGGFGGGPDQLPHLAPSYAAIAALVIVDRTDIINRETYYDFLMRMRDEQTGGFKMHENGEIDIRGCT